MLSEWASREVSVVEMYGLSCAMTDEGRSAGKAALYLQSDVILANEVLSAHGRTV